jgi:hypothetical protein
MYLFGKQLKVAVKKFYAVAMEVNDMYQRNLFSLREIDGRRLLTGGGATKDVNAESMLDV